MGGKNRVMGLMGLGGFLLGAGVGFFYRPPAVLVGQLPFRHVITRGASLKGFEQVYLEVAQRSFDYLLVGGLLGAGLGIAAAFLVVRKG
jgi:hypothetical protein